jgi:hypothetical protein
MKLITETVIDYPITGDYDINVWCENSWDDADRTVSLTFYPLRMGRKGYLETDTSVFHTLRISLWPRGPKQKAALSYIQNLVNSDGDVFDAEYTDWWSNECALVDAPELITDFVATLPRGEK